MNNTPQIRPIRRLSFFVALFAIPLVAFGGEILLEEDFDSYSGEADFSAAWAKVGNAITHLAADPEDGDNTTLFSKGDRRTRSFDPVVPTDERPLYLRADYYDSYEPDVPGREYVGLWAGAADAGSVIEVGLHNSEGEDGIDRFSARVFGSKYGIEWFDLNTTRRKGWRKIELWVFADTVEIYIDGALDMIVEWLGGEVGAIRLGFGAGSGDTASLTGVHYDNIRIERSGAPAGQGTVIELSSCDSVAPCPDSGKRKRHSAFFVRG